MSLHIILVFIGFSGDFCFLVFWGVVRKVETEKLKNKTKKDNDQDQNQDQDQD